MDTAILTFPIPVARSSGYASNSDEAERGPARSDISIRQTSLKSSTFGSSCTGKGLLPSSSTTATTVEPNAQLGLRHIATSLFSAVFQFWVPNKVSKGDKMQFCRPFKQESVNDYPEGYPQLAALVSSDDTFAIFRKFGRTSSRVLLHLQSEIATLEEKLSDLDRTDADGDSPTAYRLKSTRHKEGWDTKQRDIIHQLQEKFAIYYDLLLKDNQLRVLGPPLKRHHRYLFYWIEGKKPVIEGEDDWILHQDDLVQLANIDHFQSFLSSSWLNRLFAPSKQGDQSSDPVVTYFSQNRVATTTKLLSVLVAVAVLIIPVFILFWGSLDRGGMSATVLVSAIVFSVLLSLSTKIEIREVLLGAAAYCAVLATFLGNLQPAVSQKAFVNQ